MGIAYYVHDAADRLVESFPVTGANEADRLWIPLIRTLGLELLDVAFTGGLTASQDYYEQMVREVTAVRDALRAQEPGEPAAGSPIDRCERLLAVLVANPPDGGNRVYIG